ncbi:MAG: nucleotide exchange factor GrpE [Anaerolineae bacterium]|nr:nucleotide exchange factor GrpE [Anaerolineae bacterium]
MVDETRTEAQQDQEAKPAHAEASAGQASPEAEVTSAATGGEDELSRTVQLLEEFKEALQRERADFQNFRRRVEKEREALRPQMAAEILKRFLPVIDDFQRGIDMIPSDQKSQDWVIGIIQIHRKFLNLLEAEGVQQIDPLGEHFDPNFHEAIGADDPSEEFASGQITAVLQKGYLQGERVLRPAMVRVAS